MAMTFEARARALLGVPFRLQGRDEHGVDCIGVIIRSFGLNASAIRRDYRLRGDYRSELEQGLLDRFRRVRPEQLRSGDVMLMRVAGDQLHLGVRTDRGFVHADAGIGLVVETPGDPPWPVLGAYRKRIRTRNG